MHTMAGKEWVIFLVSILALLITITSATALPLPVTTATNTTLQCNFPQQHFLDMSDGKMNVACTVTPSTTNISCTTIIYTLTNATHYDSILQTNPTYSFLKEQNPSFTNTNGLINTYFNKKNVVLDHVAEYAVLCSTPTGILITHSSVSANQSTSTAQNIPQYILFFKTTSGYWTMLILSITLIFVLYLILAGVLLR